MLHLVIYVFFFRTKLKNLLVPPKNLILCYKRTRYYSGRIKTTMIPLFFAGKKTYFNKVDLFCFDSKISNFILVVSVKEEEINEMITTKVKINRTTEGFWYEFFGKELTSILPCVL